MSIRSQENLDNALKTEIKEESCNLDSKDIHENNLKQETLDIKKEETNEIADPLIDEFYSELSDIKQEDFKSNSKKEIDRLLRPGSTYFNLNPFETLQVDPYSALEDIKKRYKKLSIYVHPDKNPNDKERAQVAFEAVNKAYKMLEDEKERKKCLEVVDEARVLVDKTCDEKRKKLRKETESHEKKTGAEIKIDEDDPDKYRHSIYVMTCKLFADLERLRVKEAEKIAEEKKRRADEKSQDESKSKIKKEWDKNYEESRETRVSSWQNFVKKGGSTSGTLKSGIIKPAGFRPPKHKPETR